MNAIPTKPRARYRPLKSEGEAMAAEIVQLRESLTAARKLARTYRTRFLLLVPAVGVVAFVGGWWLL